MTTTTKDLDFTIGSERFDGVLVSDGPDKRPTVMVFHGWEGRSEPQVQIAKKLMAPPQDVVSLGRELSEAKADWQVHAFGNTMHAFTVPGLNRAEAGLQYNERSARRAWATLDAFLQESFAD